VKPEQIKIKLSDEDRKILKEEQQLRSIKEKEIKKKEFKINEQKEFESKILILSQK
jgi:hypothetical protein